MVPGVRVPVAPPLMAPLESVSVNDGDEKSIWWSDMDHRPFA
jgi:hypothetical protein